MLNLTYASSNNHKEVSMLHKCPNCGANVLSLFQAFMGDLSTRERYILSNRVFCDGKKVPLRVLGNKLGISGQRVDQIERAAVAKILKAMENQVK